MDLRRNADFRTLLQGVFKSQQKETALTLNVLRAHWTGIVGDSLAGKTYPLHLRENTLWVAASDACWAYELQFHKQTLLASVQVFLDSRLINEVRFKAAEIPGDLPQPDAPLFEGQSFEGPSFEGPQPEDPSLSESPAGEPALESASKAPKLAKLTRNIAGESKTEAIQPGRPSASQRKPVGKKKAPTTMEALNRARKRQLEKRTRNN